MSLPACHSFASEKIAHFPFRQEARKLNPTRHSENVCGLRGYGSAKLFANANFPHFLLNLGAGGMHVFRGAVLAITYARLHSHFMEPKKSYSRQPQHSVTNNTETHIQNEFFLSLWFLGLGVVLWAPNNSEARMI